MRDWRLIFTNSFRHPDIQKLIDKMFKGKPRIKISKEEFEQIAVQVCSLIMEGTEKDEDNR